MKRPNVLVLAGHDPSGGAGLQADIESIAANGGHAATVATLLTQQDTVNVHGALPVDDAFFNACVDTLCRDMTLAAAKTGAVASVAQVEHIVELTTALPDLPLVVDPVLVAAGGGRLAEDSVGTALRDQLFSRASVITPNVVEARQLCPEATSLDDCGERLACYGCAVLITGGDQKDDENGDAVVNRLYQADEQTQRFEWPRLPGTFHGSGCTLASAIAARLARRASLLDALTGAQRFTANALASAFAAGRGQDIPDRLHALMFDAQDGPA